MKPFLLLGIRADDAPSDNEYASFLAFSGLDEAGLRRRGSLTLWIEDAALGCWQTTGPNGQARYALLFRDLQEA